MISREKTIHEIANLEDDVYEVIDNDLSMDTRRLDVYGMVDEALAEFLQDPKVKAKLMAAAVRKAKAKHKEQTAEHKAELTRSEKLWKASKGKIPCLMECGHHRNLTKSEVLEASNNFICAACVEKLEAKGKSTWDVFKIRNVYAIFGIK